MAAPKQRELKHRDLKNRAVKTRDTETTEPFEQLDGQHPWQEAVPKGHVLYSVRELKRGRVTYFNFPLAKEMGLIPQDQPEKMTAQLEARVLKTFAIQIVNEYDIEHRPHVVRQAHPERKYMATRYLQLQHPIKNGKTSGDGRCIWNGVVRHSGRTWDVSSRGTGVTCLAPGVVAAGRPLKTGQDEVGYGCGMAELDELYGAAIMSEVFHRQGIPTERVLCVVDLGKGYGIGVRAGLNLVRPAHLFLFLKQNDHESLQSATDYFIERQCRNRVWKFNPKTADRYDQMLKLLVRDFARFAATLDVEYIFAWLDWDGDNVLADAGIIDYGSIRQFGLRHDQYRYDDVERFSTTLTEQKQKARMILQVFLQLVDFLKSGVRKPLRSFTKHNALATFDASFEKFRRERVLYRLGLSATEISFIVQAKPGLVKRFDRAYRTIEGFKTRRPIQKVADGINRPAILNIRRLVRRLPEMYLEKHDHIWISERELFNIAVSETARGRDRKMGTRHMQAIKEFQQLYREIVMTARGRRDFHRVLRDMLPRVAVINREDRMTGNSVTLVVEQLLEHSRLSGSAHVIQETVEHFVESQVLMPLARHALASSPEAILNRVKKSARPLLRALFEIVEDSSEDI